MFTKDGQGVVHPWTFMKLDSMTALYATLAGNLRTVYVTEEMSAPLSLDASIRRR